MARKIKVMISSRCTDKIVINRKSYSFTELRKEILKEIEKEKILGKEFFDVAISEYFTEPADNSSWNKCLEEIRDSDIVIIWFTGNQGYAGGGSIGICYAEYMAALQSNPSKVFLMDFRSLDILFSDGKKLTDSIKFKSEFAKQVSEKDNWLNKIEVTKSISIAKLKQQVRNKSFEILHAAIVDFIVFGSNLMRKSKHDTREGLRWSKLNYRFRQEAIKYYLNQTIKTFLNQPDFKPLAKTIITHALPDSMSIAEARELVGRPFLDDINKLSDTENGPIHVIGVYKNSTEKQIRDIIGHQDVAIIQADFGFYVWDFINHIQLVYITNCKDPQITTIQIQAFFVWMRERGEREYIIDRTKRRRKILNIVQQQKVEIRGDVP